MDEGSGAGVLDKAAVVLTVLETNPLTLAGLVGTTGLARPTAHRLAVALEHYRLVTRDLQGRFVLGPWLAELASPAVEDPLLATAGPILTRLRDITGESAQLLRRQDDFRVCSVTVECPSGLQDTVPLGAQLSMTAGSVTQVLSAQEEPENLLRLLKEVTPTMLSLQQVRHRGWTQPVAERGPGVASVSAPVLPPSGKIITVVDVSGPIERLIQQPGRPHAPVVMAAAERLGEVLRHNDTE